MYLLNTWNYQIKGWFFFNSLVSPLDSKSRQNLNSQMNGAAVKYAIVQIANGNRHLYSDIFRPGKVNHCSNNVQSKFGIARRKFLDSWKNSWTLDLRRFPSLDWVVIKRCTHFGGEFVSVLRADTELLKRCRGLRQWSIAVMNFSLALVWGCQRWTIVCL